MEWENAKSQRGRARKIIEHWSSGLPRTWARRQKAWNTLVSPWETKSWSVKTGRWRKKKKKHPGSASLVPLVVLSGLLTFIQKENRIREFNSLGDRFHWVPQGALLVFSTAKGRIDIALSNWRPGLQCSAAVHRDAPDWFNKFSRGNCGPMHRQRPEVFGSVLCLFSTKLLDFFQNWMGCLPFLKLGLGGLWTPVSQVTRFARSPFGQVCILANLTNTFADMQAFVLRISLLT